MLYIFLLSGVYFLGCHYDQGFLKFPFLPDWLSWVKVSTFSIFLALAFLVSHLILQKECHRLKMDEKNADYIVLICIIAGIVGAKIFFVLEVYNRLDSFGEAMSMLFSRGGLTWYGGFLLVIPSFYVYARKNNMNFAQLWDFATPALAAGYAIGRLACFASGDGCYGIKCPYNLPAPFAMSFPNGANPWSDIIARYGDKDVIVYNTPLFESMFSFVLFLFLWFVREKEWAYGVKFGIYLVMHSLFRYFIEFIRLNPKDVFGMTQAQFVSLILIVMGLGYIIYRIKETKGLRTQEGTQKA